jgi:hypothetical protein
MKESKFQTEFNNLIKDNLDFVRSHMGLNFAAELKVVKGIKENQTLSFPFDKLPDDQLQELCAVMTHNGLICKIPDGIRTASTRFIPEKPFDCFYMSNAQAYIVIMFYVKRKKKVMYVIKPGPYISAREKNLSENRKSIRESELYEICYFKYDFYNKVFNIQGKDFL